MIFLLEFIRIDRLIVSLYNFANDVRKEKFPVFFAHINNNTLIIVLLNEIEF